MSLKPSRNFLKALIFPTMVTIFVVISLFVGLTGQHTLAEIIWKGGLGVSGLGILAYIVFWDSPKRWPGLTWTQRAKKVFTYQR